MLDAARRRGWQPGRGTAGEAGGCGEAKRPATREMEKHGRRGKRDGDGWGNGERQACGGQSQLRILRVVARLWRPRVIILNIVATLVVNHKERCIFSVYSEDLL